MVDVIVSNVAETSNVYVYDPKYNHYVKIVQQFFMNGIDTTPLIILYQRLPTSQMPRATFLSMLQQRVVSYTKDNDRINITILRFCLDFEVCCPDAKLQPHHLLYTSSYFSQQSDYYVIMHLMSCQAQHECRTRLLIEKTKPPLHAALKLWVGHPYLKYSY